MDEGGPARGTNSSDSSTVQFRRTYDWTATSPSVAAVEALASVEGVDPLELDVALYDHVDPEALDALIDGEKPRSIRVTFSVGYYHVTFEGDELVVYTTIGEGNPR